MPSAKTTLSSNGLSTKEVLPNVVRIGLGGANAYMVGSADGPWALVDGGPPGAAELVRRAARSRYGATSRPEAIILTHGHLDHAGTVDRLAALWGTPIYAHPLEMPYLTGQSSYPPPDPTLGGPLAFMSRFLPNKGYNLDGRVQTLPEDGSVPGMMSDWHWVHTPGHTPGHISLFRETDRMLIAGDAVATTDMDSWSALLREEPRLHRPPAPETTDWETARESVERLAELEPSAVAAGHGRPIVGGEVAKQLRELATHFPIPKKGRYIGRPPETNAEEGVVELPPPADDPLPRVAAGITAGVVGGVALLSLLRRR